MFPASNVQDAQEELLAHILITKPLSESAGS